MKVRVPTYFGFGCRTFCCKNPLLNFVAISFFPPVGTSPFGIRPQRLQAASEMQALMEAIMLADKDSNYYLSDKELDQVMLRLKVFVSTSSTGGRSHQRFSEETIRTAFKNAMTHQGASLGRIHSHLQAQQDEEESASADAYKATYGYPKDTGVMA